MLPSIELVPGCLAIRRRVNVSQTRQTLTLYVYCLCFFLPFFLFALDLYPLTYLEFVCLRTYTSFFYCVIRSSLSYFSFACISVLFLVSFVLYQRVCETY